MHLLKLPTPSQTSYQTEPQPANPATLVLSAVRPGFRTTEQTERNGSLRRWLQSANGTIPSSAREFLATGPLAHIVTLGPDGTPHVTLAWAGFDGDEVVWATFFGTDQYKLRNLRRDPRIALSFQAHEHTGEGLHPYLVISGRATVTEGGALEVMDRLAEFYLGPGQKYPMRDAPPGVVTRVTVEKIYGQGPWGQGPKS
jgi:PPOX class probable F420-dependent enzyme